MNDPKITVLDSSHRQGILALRRAQRGGLIEAMQRAIEEMKYFDIKPVSCNEGQYQGLPYIDRVCDFRPGNEHNTTGEHARVDHDGNIIIHPQLIFPAGDGWGARLIDNMFPLADKVDVFTGAVYNNNRDGDGVVYTMDAKGKDFILIVSPDHIVPAHSLDFLSATKLEQEFTARELKDPDIGYVIAGSNNPGLPRKVVLPRVDRESILSILGYAKRDPKCADDLRDPIQRLEFLLELADGFYESAAAVSGASRAHPHRRILSLPFLPSGVEEVYRRIEQRATSNGQTPFYDSLRQSGLAIEEINDFGLFADPVPEYNGGLMILARKRQGITEMGEAEIRDLAGLRKLAHVLMEIFYQGLPSNDYTSQTFGANKDMYPNTRFTHFLVPRANVHAFLELGTKVYGLSSDPRQVAETMKILKNEVQGRL